MRGGWSAVGLRVVCIGAGVDCKGLPLLGLLRAEPLTPRRAHEDNLYLLVGEKMSIPSFPFHSLSHDISSIRQNSDEDCFFERGCIPFIKIIVRSKLSRKALASNHISFYQICCFLSCFIVVEEKEHSAVTA